jgi:predicted aspartyl protease/Flp pilus assembly protein TadD
LTITFTLAACIGSSSAWAVSCKVATYTPSEAYQLFLHGDYDRAATLYQTQLLQRPDDPALTASLAQVFLKQQHTKEAEDIVRKAMLKDPKSAILFSALGEVQYRQGTPWLAAASADSAAIIDICYPAAHLLKARLMRLSSYYASAAKEIATAHNLDPHDPRIRLQWLYTLPVEQRMANLESYLSADTGDDPEDLKRLRLYLAFLKKQSDEPHRACHLISATTTTAIPFARIMQDATRVRAYGLDVKLNDHNARLQIDTGAGGLVVSRSVANRAGLQEFSKTVSSGVGDKGDRSSYIAHVDSIKIGALEFRDCEVKVLEQRNVVDSDGLIGMDVLSNFLVTLDYPMRNLILGPLPPRLDETAAAKPTLQTEGARDEDSNNDLDSSTSGDLAKTGIKPAPRGPRDRYIAPEMKTWTPVYRIGHMLLLPASLNNSSVKLFILDTGAFTTTISPTVAREVTKVHSDSNVRVRGISGDVDKVYSADKITFKFANLSQEVHDVVAIDFSDLSKNEGMEISGLIGATAIGQTTMTIDYRDNLVHFTYDANRGYRY